MSEQYEPVLGTADIWEPEASQWVLLENTARELFARYGYGELRTPVFERTEVFVRGLGDETDVVQKEMYTFEDRGGRSLTLRPEGTAGVMRAIANAGLSEGEERRVFYVGPMFRGERPAAGRRRQFHQVGVEAVGRVSPTLDAECIAMLLHYLEEIGVRGGQLLLNSRGAPEDRPVVTEALRGYFAEQVGQMCGDCQRRLTTNVWRILDCKAEPCQERIRSAPAVTELLGTASQHYFRAVCASLDALRIPYTVEPRLVRGLDYYQHTVFEVIHSGLGAQNAVAGGGRYAVPLPGSDKAVEGVGFAAGMERLLLARQSLGVPAAVASQVQVVIACLGERALAAGLPLAQHLRSSGVRVWMETQAGRSLKAQLRAANRLNAAIALIQGDTELDKRVVVMKNLRSSVQEEVAVEGLTEKIRLALAGAGV
jgi:histidyl-tRNA synthetase